MNALQIVSNDILDDDDNNMILSVDDHLPEVIYRADRSNEDEHAGALQALNELHGFSYTENDFSEASYSSSSLSRSSCDPVFITIKKPTSGRQNSCVCDVIIEDEELDSQVARSKTVPVLSSTGASHQLMKKIHRHRPLTFLKKVAQDDFLNNKHPTVIEFGGSSDDDFDSEANNDQEDHDAEHLEKVLEEEKQALYSIYEMDAAMDAQIPLPYRTYSTPTLSQNLKLSSSYSSSSSSSSSTIAKHKQEGSVTHVKQRRRSKSLQMANSFKKIIHISQKRLQRTTSSNQILNSRIR